MANVNIESIVIGFLDANKPDDWFVYGDMPKDRPEKFVLVDRTGGPRDYIVQDRAEILIEVYHKDSREEASDEANRISDILINLEQIESVMRAKVTSVVKLDDLIGQYFRYQIYCDMFTRRDISTDDIVYPVVPTTTAVTSVNGKIGAVVLTAADVGAVASIVAGTNVVIDDSDPQNPVINVPDAGAVDSVNGQTGDVTLDADDIDDTATTHKFATQAQLDAADSAVQPGDLAAVATSGDYDDLANKPTIPTSLSELSGDMDDIADGDTYVKTENNYTDAEKAKLAFIAVTQNVDLDQMESDIAALANGMVYKGSWDASSGSFPGGGSAQTGWFYTVSVAGTVDGVTFAVDDRLIAITDNASTGTYAANWTKLDATDAVQSVAGLVGNISASALRTALSLGTSALLDVDTDTSLTANSDSLIATQRAVKTYVDAEAGSAISSANSYTDNAIQALEAQDMFKNYQKNDIEGENPIYIGMSEPAGGAWLIKKINEIDDDTTEITWANVSNNPTETTYDDAWATFASLNYANIEDLTFS